MSFEAELEAVKAAGAFFNGEEPVQPKRRCQIAEGLSKLGYSERCLASSTTDRGSRA
jgi:hypothetical protein